MANKYYRENLRNGTNPTKRKSNIAKIMETFGTKKKVKKEKPKKRMFANKGGGADSGRMGEIKSKVTLAADRIRKLNNDMGISTGGLTKEQIERLKKIMKRKNPKEMIPLDKGSPFINAFNFSKNNNTRGICHFFVFSYPSIFVSIFRLKEKLHPFRCVSGIVSHGDL